MYKYACIYNYHVCRLHNSMNVAMFTIDYYMHDMSLALVLTA